MRAVVVPSFGATPELIDLPVPEPGPGEILVRIHAAGMNPFDWKVADGALRDSLPHHFPLVLGSDAAGVVEKIGAGVTRFQPGARVYGQFMKVTQGRGSYADYALAADDGTVALLPSDLPFAVAAGLPTASAAAYDAIAAAELRDGQTILINGASGGVGQSAVQLASAGGGHVLATGTPDLADLLRGLGAAEIIDFTRAPTHDQVRATHPEGVDIVLDLVSGPDAIERMATLLRPGGTLLSTNFATDPDALAARGLRGVNIASRATHEVLTALAELVVGDRLRIRIDAEVPLAGAVEALARARTGQATGKTVIVP